MLHEVLMKTLEAKMKRESSGERGRAWRRRESAPAPLENGAVLGGHVVRRRRSLSRILSPRPTGEGSSHSSGPPVARGIERPTRGNGRAIRDRPKPILPPTRSCSGWGLPSPALTSGAGELLPSPFHPYLRPRGRKRSAFCGTFPRSLGAAVSGHPALRSPDFPPVAVATSGCSTSSDARRVGAVYFRLIFH